MSLRYEDKNTKSDRVTLEAQLQLRLKFYLGDKSTERIKDLLDNCAPTLSFTGLDLCQLELLGTVKTPSSVAGGVLVVPHSYFRSSQVPY